MRSSGATTWTSAVEDRRHYRCFRIVWTTEAVHLNELLPLIVVELVSPASTNVTYNRYGGGLVNEA